MSDLKKLIWTFYQPLHHSLATDNLNAFGRRQQLLGMNVMKVPHETPNISRHGEDSGWQHWSFSAEKCFLQLGIFRTLCNSQGEWEKFPTKPGMRVHAAFVAFQVVDVSWGLDLVTIFSGFYAAPGWHMWKMHPEFHPWHCNISCLCNALDVIREVLKHTFMCKICSLAHLLKGFEFWTAKPITV